MNEIRRQNTKEEVNKSLPQHDPDARPGLISGIRALKCFILWVMLLQVTMCCLAYYFRDHVLAGIDVLIVVGLYGNFLFGGVLYLEISSRRKRRAHLNNGKR